MVCGKSMTGSGSAARKAVPVMAIDRQTVRAEAADFIGRGESIFAGMIPGCGVGSGSPGGAGLPVEHAVGFLEVKSLVHRVPFEFVAETQANVPSLTDSYGAVGHLGVAERGSATAN